MMDLMGIVELFDAMCGGGCLENTVRWNHFAPILEQLSDFFTYSSRRRSEL
jgi:hypothetical protein